MQGGSRGLGASLSQTRLNAKVLTNSVPTFASSQHRSSSQGQFQLQPRANPKLAQQPSCKTAQAVCLAPTIKHNFRVSVPSSVASKEPQKRAQSSPNSGSRRNRSSTSTRAMVASKENQVERSVQHRLLERLKSRNDSNSSSNIRLAKVTQKKEKKANNRQSNAQSQDNADISAFLYGAEVEVTPSLTIESVLTARGTHPPSLDLATVIFEKAAKKYGAKLTHNKVDSVIRRSEFAAHVDRVARKYLKSLIINFERNGNDAIQAIKLEMVKQKCSELAREHYKRQLLQKGLFALINTVIQQRHKDPQVYFRSQASMTNTTLNRMLEGVISESRQSQLEEFIEIEKTLESTLSEGLTSEPCIGSARKPPIAPATPHQQPLVAGHKFESGLGLHSQTNDGSKLQSGVQSPSVTELQGEFQAFCEEDEQETTNEDLQKLSESDSEAVMELDLDEERLGLSAEGKLTATSKQQTPAAFFVVSEPGTQSTVGKNHTFGRGQGPTTHVKIAQLFKTTVQSSIDTHVDEQIKRLDEMNQEDESDIESASETKNLMASYVRKQVLLGKAFAALVVPRKQVAKETTARPAEKSKRKTSKKKAREQQCSAKYEAYRSTTQTDKQNLKSRANSKKKASSSNQAKAAQTKVAEAGAPVEFEKPVRLQEKEVMQSCVSSPQNRLQKILTDSSRPVSHHFLSQQQQLASGYRQSNARSRLPSPLDDTQRWQSQDSRHMLYLEQSGVRLHQKSLKRQIFKSLEYNVQITRMNELRADQYFKQRALRALRHLMYQKRREIQIEHLFAQSRQEKLLASTFRNWRGRFFETQVVAQFQREALMRHAFRLLLKGTLHAQQSRQIGSVCRMHFQAKLLRRILQDWNQITADNFEPRKKLIRARAHMQRYRMSRLVKEWFNQIDLLKHELALQRDVLRSRARRLKGQFFGVWLAKYQQLSRNRERHHKLAQFSQENFARRYFSPWLKLTRRKLEKRQKFFETRARNLNSKALQALKLNVYNSSGEMQKARKVILIRAERLIRTSFYRGLLAYTKMRQISRHKRQLAQEHHQAFLIIRGFRAIERHTLRCRKAKVIERRANVIRGHKLFTEWQVLAKNINKAKKLRSKILIERQFQVLKTLYEHSKRCKIYKRIIGHCLQRYSLRLLETAMEHLKSNIVNQRAKREINAQIDDYYGRQLQGKVLQGLLINKQVRRQNMRLVRNFQIRHEDKKVEAAFRQLRANRIHEQFKRSYKPFLAARNMDTMERCFNALRDWKTNRVTIKGMLSAHLNYRQGCMLENAFEGLMAFMQYSRQNLAMKEQADVFRANNLLFKSVQTLSIHKMCKKNQKALIADVQKIRRKVHFISWFNLVHDERPNEKKADEFHIRFLFQSMRNLAVANRSLRAKRSLLAQLSQEYYPYMLKKRGVCKWRSVKDRAQFVTQTTEKIREGRLRRLFNGWWNNVDRLGEGKGRQIMQRELNKRFQYRRVLTAFRMHADEKIHQKQIIKVFQTKHGMIEKARIFSALIRMNCSNRLNGREFFEKMHVFGKKQLQDAFTHWRNSLMPARNHDMAELFYENRASKFLLRKCFDRLRLGANVYQKKSLKDNWLNKVHESQLLRRCFNDLAIHAKSKVKARHVSEIMTKRLNLRLLARVFDSLAENCSTKQRLDVIESNILHAFNKIRLRKVMIALQDYTATSLKAKIVTAKWNLRMKNKFLARWQDQRYKTTKLHRMVTIFNEQNALTFIRAFMLKLDDASYYMVFRKSLDRKLKAKAIQVLKQKWLLRKMQDSLVARHLVDLKRKVIMALKFNQFDRVSLRTNIKQQADLYIDEDKFDLIRNCFAKLKMVRYLGKATRIARGTYGLHVLRRAFTALRSFNLHRKQCQVNYNEVLILRKQKYLHKMLAEFDKRQREREAEAIINFDRVHTVMQAWKNFTVNQKLARQFREQTYFKGLRQTVIASLQKNVIIENFQRMMYGRIKKRQDVELKRDAFNALRSGIKLKLIQNNMKVYHLHKFQKRVIQQWRRVVERKNFFRINLIKQRAAIIERPYLAKPLLAMRNLLLFKAFRSIMLNANVKKEIKFNRQICTYSIYLRLQRKAFYGLRLNAAARYQRKKSKEIKKLMIVRRWFTYLKRITQMQKVKRKKQTDAAIFRFLSLQRRGLLQWVSFVSKKKRVQIKRHFSLTLYYNRMCDKVFTALRVNAQVKARKRKEIDQASGYITTSSSEIMHEASFTHRTKLNMSSLQQFVNSSNPNLQCDIAQVAALSSINHVNSDHALPSQFFNNALAKHGNTTTLAMMSEPQMSPTEGRLYQHTQNLTSNNNNQLATGQELNSSALASTQDQGFNSNSGDEVLSQRQTVPDQPRQTQNHQHFYNNFYQSPIDRVERAQPSQQLYGQNQMNNLDSCEQLPHPLYNDSSQLSSQGGQNQMLLIQTSLPTPHSHEVKDFRGADNRIRLVRNHELIGNYHSSPATDAYMQQQQQLHPFQGDLSQPQQLTLGTMPDQQMGSQEKNRPFSDSFRTQHWMTSPPENAFQQTDYAQHRGNAADQPPAPCQLCQNGIRHDHNADIVSQMTKFQQIADNQAEEWQRRQSSANNISESAARRDEQERLHAKMDGKRSPSPVQFDNRDPPERDYNNNYHHYAANYFENQNQKQVESFQRRRHRQNEHTASADLISKQMLDELMSESCYDDHAPGIQDIQDHIKVNMDNINVIQSQSMMTSQRSTPDMIYSQAQGATHDGSYFTNNNAYPHDLVDAMNQAVKSKHNFRNDAMVRNQNAYSHPSALKTTPGAVRSHNKLKSRKLN